MFDVRASITTQATLESSFNTAVTTATEAIDKLRTTAESHHRVMVVEIMGRYAGWLALEAGIAGAATAILIPERILILVLTEGYISISNEDE